MQQTSLFAYCKLISEGELAPRQAEVFTCFKQCGDMTNKQVSIRLGLDINQITGRVKELRDYGLLMQRGSVMQNNDRPALLWGVVR